MVIFHSLLNMAGINPQIVYFANTYKARENLKELALHLTEEHLERKARVTNIEPEIRGNKKHKKLNEFQLDAKKQTNFLQVQENVASFVVKTGAKYTKIFIFNPC